MTAHIILTGGRYDNIQHLPSFRHGITKTNFMPYQPQSKGEAERAAQTVTGCGYGVEYAQNWQLTRKSSWLKTMI